MVCLSSFCKELPALAGWLPQRPAFPEALIWEQVTAVCSTGLPDTG